MSEPCQCPAGDNIAFCERHRCEKTGHWRKLCREHDGYRTLWDEDKGPGQLVGLRCGHRSAFDSCPFCAASKLVTPEDERGSKDFTIGGETISIRESAGQLCVWPAALLLAERIIANPPKGTVVDLGCGTGIVGLAALAVGCKVTFLDSNPEAVRLAQENAQANGFTKFDTMEANWSADQDRTWDNVFGSEVLWGPADRFHLSRWIALHWSGVGQCLLSHSGARIESEVFGDMALTVSEQRRDGEGFSTNIYEVKL